MKEMDMLSVWTEHPPRITSHQSILASWDMSVLNIGTVQSPLTSFRSSSLGYSRMTGALLEKGLFKGLYGPICPC